ncbi:hypothetical protein AAULH_14251, partial [Lactobacillus helveticus MTCC 5463]
CAPRPSEGACLPPATFSGRALQIRLLLKPGEHFLRRFQAPGMLRIHDRENVLQFLIAEVNQPGGPAAGLQRLVGADRIVVEHVAAACYQKGRRHIPNDLRVLD